jgi:hypothetical protein
LAGGLDADAACRKPALVAEHAAARFFLLNEALSERGHARHQCFTCRSASRTKPLGRFASLVAMKADA